MKKNADEANTDNAASVQRATQSKKKQKPKLRKPPPEEKQPPASRKRASSECETENEANLPVLPKQRRKVPSDDKLPKAAVGKETTRHRFQARTGLKGAGNNKSFSYKPGATDEEQDEQLRQAKCWVQKQWEANKLPLDKLPWARVACA